MQFYKAVWFHVWGIQSVPQFGGCKGHQANVRNVRKFYFDLSHLFVQLIKKTQWPYSASELYRQSGRRRSAKLVPTFAARGESRGQRNESPRPLISFFWTGAATFYSSSPTNARTNYCKIVDIKNFKITTTAPTCFGLHKPSSGSSQSVLRQSYNIDFSVYMSLMTFSVLWLRMRMRMMMMMVYVNRNMLEQLL